MTTHLPTRLLVAVDDSPAALAAVRLAVALAIRTGGSLLFVHVLHDGELARALAAEPRVGRAGERPRRVGERQSAAGDALLRHVLEIARRAGVGAEGVSLRGEPASVVLVRAAEWRADLLVLGRSDVRGPGQPSVGAVTRHVLEFSEQPVLVVPHPG